MNRAEFLRIMGAGAAAAAISISSNGKPATEKKTE
jgi:hypothetical protein